MPLQDGQSAPAKILNNKGEAILLEMYAVKPVKYVDDLSVWKSVIQNSKTFIIWAFDECVRNGEWKIIGNISVKLPVEMPLFWSMSHMSDGGSYIMYRKVSLIFRFMTKEKRL